MFSSLLYVSFVAFWPSSYAALCKFPDGSDSPSDTPCNSDSVVSACCYTGQACLSNGLCVSDPHNDTLARVHRGTCTDSTWKSSACPRECLDVENNGVSVYSCNQTNSDSYCCYDNCQCNSQFQVFSFSSMNPYTLTIIGESYTNTHTSTPSTTATTSNPSSVPASSSAETTATSAPQSIASPTSTQSSNDTAAGNGSSHSKTNATAIGVGVGVGVGAALLLLGGLFWFWRRKGRKSPYHGPVEGSYEAPDNEVAYVPTQKFAHHASVERGELPGNITYDPVELEARDLPK